LVSPPESKYVRILASVLFQIGQYARIGQVDSLRVLPIPARYLNEPFQNALSSMGDSNSCPSVANRAVWAREILTQIKGQLKGHSGGGWSATTSDGRRLPAMQETPILWGFSSRRGDGWQWRVKLGEGGLGAPRPMKMGTTASPWRYDVGAYDTPLRAENAKA
jgi:hypothetical protein